MALAEYENQNPGTQPTAKGTKLEAETTTLDEHPAKSNTVICPSCASRLTNPQASEDPSSDSPPIPSTQLASTPSNILLGIQGLQRLFAEFQTALVEKEGRIARLETEADVQSAELHRERELVRKAVTEKEEMRRDLNMIKADDESASKVVERYM